MKPAGKKTRNPSQAKPADLAARLSNPLVSIAILTIITILVYGKTLSLDFTKLDDSIFIVENASYNAELKNIGVSFQRGLFNPTKDAYYRPLFLVDFILESRLFGTNPAGYHFTNLLFHLISVSLLFLFLRRTGISPDDSFLLALLFAVLPVLTQAVAWIPGRNDMVLMIFFLSAFLLLFRYAEKPSYLLLAMHFILLLAALFTKETAIIIPVIMGIFGLFHLKCGWRRLILPAVSWVAAIGVWLWVRSTATLAHNWLSPGEMLQAGFDRLEVILQYLGKIFLPVNLAVFPEAQDITLGWGVLALAGFTGLLVYSRSYRAPLTWIGLFWFLVFLVPVLIVPKTLNDQVFEHRLYLPVVGIFLMLSQAFPFGGRLKTGTKMVAVGSICLVFAVQSFIRTDYFSDPVTFWTHAVQGSPRSAYAKTLLGTKVDDTTEREKLFREARALDPYMKNLNYYLAKVLWDTKRYDSAEVYLRREVAHNPIPDAYFLLAQIEFTRNNLDSAALHLEKVIELNPYDPQANHNLALLHFQNGRPEKAREIVNGMQSRGMAVEPDLLRLVAGGQ